MSVLDNILAGIAGGLKGGVQGYEAGQDMLDRKAQRAQQAADLRLRQRQHDDVIQARLDAEKDRETAAADRAAAAKQGATEKQRAAQWQFIMGMPDGPDKAHMMALYGPKLFPDIDFSDGADAIPQAATPPPLPGAALPMEASPDGTPAPAGSPVLARQRVVLTSPPLPHTDIEPLLPSYLQGPYHASGHKMTFTPDQWANPPMTAAQKREAALDTFRREEAIRHSYDKPPAPPTVAPTDDPSLPSGAKQYISSLATKFDGDYKLANDEFTRALPLMLAAHPRMDPRKARLAFDAGFSVDQRPRGSNILDIIAGFGTDESEDGTGSQGTPASTPPAALRQPAAAPTVPSLPTTPSPVAPADNPALGELVSQANELLAQYRAESNPQRKAALAGQLRALRGQLADAKGAPEPAGGSASRGPDAEGRVVTPEQIAAVARMRGTTPDVERKRAVAEGFSMIGSGVSADDIASPHRTVTDEDVATLARSVLTSTGRPATDANIRTYVKENRAALVQQIVKMRRSAAHLKFGG